MTTLYDVKARHSKFAHENFRGNTKINFPGLLGINIDSSESKLVTKLNMRFHVLLDLAKEKNPDSPERDDQTFSILLQLAEENLTKLIEQVKEIQESISKFKELRSKVDELPKNEEVITLLSEIDTASLSSQHLKAFEQLSSLVNTHYPQLENSDS